MAGKDKKQKKTDRLTASRKEYSGGEAKKQGTYERDVIQGEEEEENLSFFFDLSPRSWRL